jgi:hypothetical protein
MPSSGGSVSDAPVNKVVDGKSHYLAYITPDEGKSLVDQGGREVVTDSGIPAYPSHFGGGGDTRGRDPDPGPDRDPNRPTMSDVAGPVQPTQTVTPTRDDRQTYSPHTDTPTQIADQEQLDRDARARQFDYEGEAAGQGTITSNNYDAETGTFDIKQTTGTISAVDYQKSNLETYLNSGEVSDKDKAKTLNQLQAIQNSQLVGTKQGKSDIEAKDFVMDNLSSSLDYVKGLDQYNKYTSMIDKDTTTYAADFKDNPLKTVITSGGVLMSMGKGLYDNYKNKKAMNILGYTSKVYNPRTGDYGEGGNRMLTGGATPGEREAMTQLASAAPYIASGTGQPSSSVAASWFANLGNSTQGFNFNSAYANAKAKVAQTLGNPGSVGQLAVNQSPFYNWLKDNSLDKGIL